MARPFLFITGVISLVLGIAGILTPLLPTTPFLLLSSFCFARSSHKFHSWLIHHKHLGPPIRDWEERGVIGYRQKIMASLLIMINAAFPLYLIPIQLPLKIATGVILIGVLVFIWLRPTS